LKDQLLIHLRKFTTAPFLFVGSGLSRRYLGSETWEGLLRRFAAKTPQSYDYYRASAGGDLPRIATEISKAFHEIWWHDPQYEESRAVYSAQSVAVDSALKIEIAKYISGQSKGVAAEGGLAEEVAALRKAVVDGVITTNWDTFLEETFPEFRGFVGQDELLFSAHQGIGEIYKIHGCVSRPTSIVLTAADYDLFNERNAYLAAKLLTVFVEHPVVFLGYSLSDRNIAQVLRGIGTCLTSANIGELRDRLIFVSWEPDISAPEIVRSDLVILDGFSIPVLQIRTASLLPVFECLGELRRVFPARILRRLKEQVYALVRENDPKRKLYVIDIDDSRPSSDVEVVFGVGAISAMKDIGYRGLTRDDLIDSLLDEKSDFDARRVVSETLPRLLKATSYVPAFRYLRLGGFIKNGAIDTDVKLDRRVLECARSDLKRFLPATGYRNRAAKLLEKYKTFDGFASSIAAADVLRCATAFPETAFAVDSLRAFLLSNRSRIRETDYVKLVCVYDWISNSGRAATQESTKAA